MSAEDVMLTALSAAIRSATVGHGDVPCLTTVHRDRLHLVKPIRFPIPKQSTVVRLDLLDGSGQLLHSIPLEPEGFTRAGTFVLDRLDMMVRGDS